MKHSWQVKSGMIVMGLGLVLLLLQAGVQAGEEQVVSTPSGLQYVDLVTGNGKVAKSGDMAVSCHASS